jgi:thioesterase domain-containing protein
VSVSLPWRKQVGIQWKNFVACEGRSRFKYLTDRVRIALGRWPARLFGDGMDVEDRDAATIALQLPSTIRKVARSYWRMARAYKPRPFAGCLVLFRAAEQAGASQQHARDPYLGWEGLPAGGIEVHEVPGTHVGLLRSSNIPHLAEVLGRFLDGNHHPSQSGEMS